MYAECNPFVRPNEFGINLLEYIEVLKKLIALPR